MIGATLLITFCAKRESEGWKHIHDPALAARLKSFVAEKVSEANADPDPMPPGVESLLAVENQGNWLVASNLYMSLRNPDDQTSVFWGRINRKTREAFDDFCDKAESDDWPVLSNVCANLEQARLRRLGEAPDYESWWRGNGGDAVAEIQGVLEAFGRGDEKYSVLYGNDIIESIPRGSVFLGTYPGYSIVSAIQESQVQGEPFFTLSQNELPSRVYLAQARSQFGGQIYIPTDDDDQHCFEELQNEIRSRMSRGGHEHSTGYEIFDFQGMLSKLVFDRNTNRDFYIEQGYMSQWAYPCLEPHGLIFKINRRPVTVLADAVLKENDDYWRKVISPMIGDWVNDKTTVAQIAAFAEKVFLRHDFNGFYGDPEFVQNEYEHNIFSEERGSFAAFYLRRAGDSRDAAEMTRMNHEADFAFRQAWALAPASHGVALQYTNFLLAENRISEAPLVAGTTLEVSSGTDRTSMEEMLRQILTPQQFRVLLTSEIRSLAPAAN